MQRLVVRLILATVAAAVAAVTATALVVHLLDERDRLRTASETDLAALVSLAEVTSDREALLRGIARTPAGREGRLAVHVDGTTVGSSQLAPRAVIPPAEVPFEGGTVVVRAAGAATVEVFVPGLAPGSAELGLAALLLGVGALAAAAGAVLAARRVRPVVAELAELAAGTEAIGHDDDHPPAPRPTAVPETAAIATALASLTARFAEARSRERKLAADLSHRLRTPLTALALDAGGIGDGPAAERVRQTVASLENDVDALIRATPTTDGPARCDVAEVVRRRMAFWSALAQHGGRPCTLVAEPPAVIALSADDLAAVVDALLGNVFRYTPAGAPFAVTVVRHAGWVSLVVDDAGLGVSDPAAALSRGVSMGGGTGLGLPIARDAVEATGGTIHVERAALGGARIRLRFAEARSST
ncbi:HAMP domain-containing histidine kinase [Pseudonocardia sp. DSM 110487]|uniref:sensor histidine kinase n=1 Tax=Pseudonocardia sp. DSM 110487 TaxID=2865833 RepID=UPI001C698BFF|nr:HAMP domain-containing sensor histidine kinase [Pseudonocardia sp. DSM 110487]QYN37403.1 HAMP domain-containing histidine kinase [Pseudonocardia sp. DSM 110487]